MRPLEFALALVAALALWFLLREKAPVVERALSVPLEAVGLGSDRVADGLPKEVLVRVRGPAPLVEDRTLPVSAYLDLSGVEGPFAREVQVAVPQGVEVVEVRPARVEGRVEALVRQSLPVLLVSPEGPVTPERASVEAQGPRSQMEKARLALGLDTGKEEVALVAFGEEPLPGVRLSPDRVRVKSRSSFLAIKEVPLRPVPPGGYRVLEFSPRTVRLVGPETVLKDVEEVEARLPATQGVYQGSLDLQLPPGVSPVGVVLGRARLALE
ncbi:CdaR family protein [Thermus filiformis]|uniref:YbbR-like domain-containing protein n=1 Tax=Thermus filiformis TaxID=276 RepID=A0A0D6XA54_THEFI|nr:CdaR family protein [Thermus filiformis]KIX84635.1 hypothetical protein THFILI_05515 [Thermus filiformis]